MIWRPYEINCTVCHKSVSQTCKYHTWSCVVNVVHLCIIMLQLMGCVFQQDLCIGFDWYEKLQLWPNVIACIHCDIKLWRDIEG